MTRTSRNAITCIAILLAMPGTASAYLDPGTGSMLLQGLIAVIAASVAVISTHWRATKDWVGRIRRRDKAPGPGQEPPR